MRILIVDDIFTNRFLLSEILNTLGLEYDEVENGREAIEAIQQKPYDLVLMDIEMPVMNGLEATRHIRENMPPPVNSLFIVAMTAHDPGLFIEDYRGIGFDNFLVKPYNLENLSALIRQAKGR